MTGERQRKRQTERAIFLDRDGTLVHARHYPKLPEDLILYEGIDAQLRTLRAAGFQLIVVTNQSGMARGYFSEQDLMLMHDHLTRSLGLLGVAIDGFYYCPHHPDGVVDGLAIVCDCRKPQPGMVRRAARERGIDPRRSWFVGDILDDVEAGNTAGCRTVLVDLGTEAPPSSRIRQPAFVERTTAHALDIILAEEGLGPAASLAYRPDTWIGIGAASSIEIEAEAADAVAG